MRLMTQNLRAFPRMRQWKVVEDVCRTADQAKIILWQEIGPKRYKQAIRNLPKKFSHAHMNTLTPITYNNRRYTKLDQGSVLLHEAAFGIIAERRIVWVLLRDLRNGDVFYVVNCHYVPGAWSPNRNFRKAHRVTMWEEGQRRHKELIEDLAQANLPIIGGGDMNRRVNHPKGPVLGREIAEEKVRYPVPGSSIDHLYMINSPKQRWKFLGAATLDRKHTDHAGRRVRVVLRSRRR